MEITITTDKRVINIETKFDIIPGSLIALAPVIDQYPPHQLEVLFEKDAHVKKVSVDFRPLPF